MSRSRKRTPVFNIASSKGRKEDRELANRKFRRKEKVALHMGDDPPERLEEVSDVWGWDCDGWRYYPLSEFNEDFQDAVMRK